MMQLDGGSATATHKGQPQARIDRIELMLFDEQAVCEVSVQSTDDTFEAWLAQDAPVLDASPWLAHQWPGFAFLFFEQAYVPEPEAFVCEQPASKSADTLEAWLAMDVPESEEAIKDESRMIYVDVGLLIFCIIGMVVLGILIRRSYIEDRAIAHRLALAREEEQECQRQEDERRRTMPAPHREPAPDPEQQTPPAAPETVKDIVLPFTPRQVAQTGQPVMDVPPEVRCTMCDRCQAESTGLLQLMAEDILLPAVWSELVVHNGTKHHLSSNVEPTHLFLASDWDGARVRVYIGGEAFTCQISKPPESGEVLVVDETNQVPLVWRHDKLITSLMDIFLPSDFWIGQRRREIMEVHRAMFECAAAALEPDEALRQSRRAALKARRDREAIDRFAVLKHDQLLRSRTDLEAKIKRLTREEASVLAQYTEACMKLPSLDDHLKRQEQVRGALAQRCVQAFEALQALPIVERADVDEDLFVLFVSDDAGQWSVHVPLGGHDPRRAIWTHRPPANTQAASTSHIAPAAAIMNAMAGPLAELDLATLVKRLHNMVRAGILVPFNQETL